MRKNAHSRSYVLKVTGIRPMAPVLNRGPLEGIRAENVKFFGKLLKMIKNYNSLVVILSSKVGESEFLQTL